MMNGKFQRATGILLAGVLCLTVFPVQVRAQEDGSAQQREAEEESTTLEGTFGENGSLSWVFDKKTQTLTVSGEDTFEKREWEDSFHYMIESEYDVSIKKLVFKDCKIKGSGGYLCDNMKELESCDLSGLDTSEMTDMRGMFGSCSNLTSLDVSKFDTSKVTDMGGMFYGCSSLTSLDVSKFDTSNVTDMRGMFNGCSGLTSLDVSKFDTSKVTEMGGMFWDCSGLTSLDVSKFDTSKVTYMGSMFKDCGCLTSLDVSKFDTSKVTDMSEMFEDCYSLMSLDVSKFDTSKVTDMYSMFTFCESLTSLDVSNFDTSNVTNMGWMFYVCSDLTSLDVSNFDTSNVTDMRNMFYDCSSLTELDVSKFDTSKVTDMGEMFYGCSSLTSLDVSKFDTSNVTYMRCMISGCSGLTELDLSSFDTSDAKGRVPGRVDEDAAKLFAYNWSSDKLKIIRMPKKMGENGIGELPGTFYDGDGKEYSYGTADTAGKILTSIPGMEIPYKIRYVLGGGVNSASNPAKGRSDQKIVLADAVYPCHTFVGWYTTSDFKEKITAIPEGTKQDVTLYAKWEEAHSFNDGEVTKKATCKETGVKTYTCTVCGEKKEDTIAKSTEHSFNAGEVTKEATCKEEGVKSYTCTVCGEKKTEKIEKAAHKYEEKVTAATLSADGSIAQVCAVCGEADPKGAVLISRPKEFTLSAKSYVYDGKAKKPSVTVKDASGKEISAAGYKVTYAAGRKKVGSYSVKVVFQGNYSGTKTLAFTINPAPVKLKGLTAGSKAVTVKWEKKTKEVTGYELQYSTDKKFGKSGTKTVTIKKNSTASKKVTGLKAKKKYYVRIRTYKTVSGKKYYSGWSKVKNVTTKK